MTRINQLIALLNGQKTRTHKEISEIYKKLQKDHLFDGLSRVYYPSDEEGEELPPENKLVQYTTDNAINDAVSSWVKLFDITFGLDRGNTLAKADVVVDHLHLQDIPVTYLLFLEKQLNDVRTFIASMPTLDPAFDWSFDENRNVYAAGPIRSNRSKKVPRNHVKAEATEHHPAQVEVYHEDTKVGEWHTTKFSGAMPAKRKKECLERVDKLIAAVKIAREEANSTEIPDNTSVAESIFKFIFGSP